MTSYGNRSRIAGSKEKRSFQVSDSCYQIALQKDGNNYFSASSVVLEIIKSNTWKWWESKLNHIRWMASLSGDPRN